MADHIVVFDGPERLIGQIVRARVEDATAFTLFARVETAELASGEHNAREAMPGLAEEACATPVQGGGANENSGRFSLPLT